MIKRIVRRLIRLFANFFGVESPIRDQGPMAVRNPFSDVRPFIESRTPLIIDGGANKGDMIKIFLQQYHSPIIHAFEPIPELAEYLKKTFQSNNNVHIHAAALGAEERLVPFQVVANKVSSSVLTPSEKCRGYHGENLSVTNIIEVPQVCLKNILTGADIIDLVKLDLQGYELEALKGFGDLLCKVKALIVEVEFVALYENQPLFGDIDIFLRNSGFRLLNLYGLWTQVDGQLTSGDAVYLNSRLV